MHPASTAKSCFKNLDPSLLEKKLLLAIKFMCVHSCNTLSRLLNLCRSQLSKIWMRSLTSAELLRQATFCSFAKILSLQFTYYTVVQKLDKFIVCSFNFLSVTANIFSKQSGRNVLQMSMSHEIWTSKQFWCMPTS